MPAGSGPSAVALSAVAVGTTEGVLATLTGNWNEVAGTLITLAGEFTPPAAVGTLVIRCRQTSLTGTQVGPTVQQAYASAVAANFGTEFFDPSAFGQSQPGLPGATPAAVATYVVTAQYAAGAGGAFTGMACLETAAPVN